MKAYPPRVEGGMPLVAISVPTWHHLARQWITDREGIDDGDQAFTDLMQTGLILDVADTSPRPVLK